MRKIVAPLALLASISLLTSCTKTEVAPTITPAATETPAPVMEDTVPPTPPAPPVPTDLPTPPAPSAPVSPMPSETPVDTGSAVAPVSPISRTETIKYNTPAGGDSIEFSVTVTDGVITSATATQKAENEISKKMQQGFIAKLSESVVGKKAKDLDVSAIGGASLATNAFKLFVQTF